MFPLGTVLFPQRGAPAPRVRAALPRARPRRACAATAGSASCSSSAASRWAAATRGSRVGTVARIVEAARTPDGRYLLATVGTDRLRVRRGSTTTRTRAPRSTCSREPKRVGERRVAAARRGRAAARAASLALRAELGEPAAPVDAAQLDADPVRASFEAAAMAPIGPLDAQRLLELDDPRRALRRARGAARRRGRGARVPPRRRLT